MDYNTDYNIELPSYFEEISFSEVKALPVFGTDVELFQEGYRALLVFDSTTREKMVEYALQELRAPIMDTVVNSKGVTTFTFQMYRVIIDEKE